MESKDMTRPTATWAMPMAVGALLLLYGLGLWLMSEGEANPALVLLAAVAGVAALAWGYYVKSRQT